MITLRPSDSMLSVMSGVFSFACASMFTFANQLEKASRVAALDFTQIIFGYIIDVIVFNTQLTILEVSGCFVIAACGLLMFYSSFKLDDLSKDHYILINDENQIETNT